MCNQGWGFANLGLLTAALRVYRNAQHAPLVRIDMPVDAATDGGWDFPAPVIYSDSVNVSWHVLGAAAAYELSIEGVPSSVIKTEHHHGVLDLSQLPNACWLIKVHAISASQAFAASSPQPPPVPIVNGTCQRFWGSDFGPVDYLAVQLNRA